MIPYPAPPDTPSGMGCSTPVDRLKKGPVNVAQVIRDGEK